jgi:hypothetical protein
MPAEIDSSGVEYFTIPDFKFTSGHAQDGPYSQDPLYDVELLKALMPI